MSRVQGCPPAAEAVPRVLLAASVRFLLALPLWQLHPPRRWPSTPAPQV